MNQNELQMMSEHYRAVRKAVYEEATRPLSNNPVLHQNNKVLLRNLVEKLGNDADLNKYRGTDKDTAATIWHHLWTINRYAGIRSQIATTEISHIESIFDDYESFAGEDWNIKAAGNSVISGGRQVKNFLNRTGDFAGKQTVGNVPKLVKIVSVARQLTDFINKKNPEAQVLNFITNGCRPDDVWAIHGHLMSIGYRSNLTVLHFMMGLGFQVIKPDIVITKLFLDWGWLHKINPEFPVDLTFDDLRGKGKYGARFQYTSEKMYKPLINLARQIAAHTKQEDLKRDIGWVTVNPIREFDIFVVKYGQKPERDFGIARTLYEDAAKEEKSMKPAPASICRR